jgi:hypothetical protein
MDTADRDIRSEEKSPVADLPEQGHASEIEPLTVDRLPMDFAHPRWLLSPMVYSGSRPDRNVIGINDHPKIAASGRRKPRVALLLHGIACTWSFMQKLQEDLTELRTASRRRVYEKVYFVAFDWRRPIEENGVALRRLLEELNDQVKCADLYGYSSGGLVCRVALELVSGTAPIPVRSLFALHAPHRGSPLAFLIHSGLPGIGSFVSKEAGRWSEPGVRDLVPGSALLKRLWAATPPAGVQTVLVAGDGGARLFGGLTRPAFLFRASDGVVSVNSQLDQVGSGPDRNPRARRLLFPGHHFSVADGLDGLGNGPEEVTTALDVLLDAVLAPVPA